MRDHDVTALTGRELEVARRELAASLALARPGSPVRAPILAQMSAIDSELARRAAGRPDGLPGSPPLLPRRVNRDGLRGTPRCAGGQPEAAKAQHRPG